MYIVHCSMHGHWRARLNFDVSPLQEGGTALYFACQHGHTKVVILLLEHGAQVDLPTDVSHVFLTRIFFSVYYVT